MAVEVRVQDTAFDFGAEANGFAPNNTDIGAVVTFSGRVRADGDLKTMVIEHYPGMTEAALRDIAFQAEQRWSLNSVLIIHRYGELTPGEAIMMVATASPHRADAFAAADFLMDYLKSRAPFWKKEIGAQGASWVASKDSDEAALDRWRD